MKKIISLSDIVVIAILVILLGVLILKRNFIYFRDYSIIYDGASRILHGEKPYIDFGLPVGPVVFLLCAFFLKIFNEYWMGLIAAQYLFNIIMLISVYGIYKKIKLNTLQIQLSITGFTVFYLVFQTHPWYNSLAVMFLLITQYFLLIRGNGAKILAGFFAALTLLSKQDIGLMLVFATIIQLIISEDKVYKIILFFNGYILAFIIFISQYGLADISYWLNFGQHGQSRNPFDNQPTIISLISLSIFVYGVAIRQNLYLVCGIIAGISSISINTSGLYFTHFYFVAGLLPIFLYLMGKNYLNFIAYGAAFLFMIRPILINDYFLMSNLLENKPEHYLFNSKYIKSDIEYSDMKQCDYRLTKILAPNDTCRLITDVKDLISEKILPMNGKILNLSELKVLNSIIGYKNLEGHPLWYDEGIALYKREKNLIRLQLESDVFDLIVFDSTNISNDSHDLITKELIANKNEHYKIKKYSSPSDLTDCNFNSQCPKNIWIMYKSSK